MTNKFKVGDMVRILNVVDSEFKEGAIGVIEDCDHSGYREWKITVNGDYEWFDADEFELVETTHKDSERITKLEEEVAELKLIVAQIRKPSTVVEEALANDVTDAQAEKLFEKQLIPKTANKLRAEIIEKAKGFVEESKVELTLNRGRGYVIHPGWICDLTFKVNEEKRTVVAILSWKPDHYKKSDVKARGIAKCDPSDVFNEHIGKAIALGRALGLDVSEFEQAVQPNEVVVGQIIVWDYKFKDPYKINKRTGDWFDFTRLADNQPYSNHEYCEIEKFTTIINDTNAIYETAVNE